MPGGFLLHPPAGVIDGRVGQLLDMEVVDHQPGVGSAPAPCFMVKSPQTTAAFDCRHFPPSLPRRSRYGCGVCWHTCCDLRPCRSPDAAPYCRWTRRLHKWPD
jgi:hypothetical protein